MPFSLHPLSPQVTGLSTWPPRLLQFSSTSLSSRLCLAKKSSKHTLLWAEGRCRVHVRVCSRVVALDSVCPREDEKLVAEEFCCWSTSWTNQVVRPWSCRSRQLCLVLESWNPVHTSTQCQGGRRYLRPYVLWGDSQISFLFIPYINIGGERSFFFKNQNAIALNEARVGGKKPCPLGHASAFYLPISCGHSEGLLGVQSGPQVGWTERHIWDRKHEIAFVVSSAACDLRELGHITLTPSPGLPWRWNGGQQDCSKWWHPPYPSSPGNKGKGTSISAPGKHQHPPGEDPRGGQPPVLSVQQTQWIQIQ